MYCDLGSYLQRLRLKSRLTLRSVSHKTKIRESILEQIEKGSSIDMPKVIRKSYINSFAKVVGADLEKVAIMLDVYENESPQINQNVSLSAKLPRLPRINKLATALTVLFLFSLSWFLRDNHIEMKETASLSSFSKTTGYKLEAKYYQREKAPQIPSSIEGILNSPSPSYDKNK